MGPPQAKSTSDVGVGGQTMSVFKTAAQACCNIRLPLSRRATNGARDDPRRREVPGKAIMTASLVERARPKLFGSSRRPRDRAGVWPRSRFGTTQAGASMVDDRENRS